MKTRTDNSRVLPILLLLLGLMSCGSKRSLESRDYMRFLNSENCKLYVAKVINKVKFMCRLQTPEMMALMQTEQPFINEKEFKASRAAYEHQLNVVFLIADESVQDHQVKETVFKTEVYSQLLAYASNGLERDFKLQLGDGELVPCSFVHVEAANSIQPVIRIVASFNGVDERTKDYSLIFDDSIFNNGRIKFHYGPEVFASLPTLKL